MPSQAFIEARIARTQELIVAYEDAIEALLGGAQSYSLDTGQTRQQVTKAQLSQLQLGLERLENRLSVLEARLCGAGIVARPAF
jgi:hypothetical protein